MRGLLHAIFSKRISSSCKLQPLPDLRQAPLPPPTTRSPSGARPAPRNGFARRTTLRSTRRSRIVSAVSTGRRRGDLGGLEATPDGALALAHRCSISSRATCSAARRAPSRPTRKPAASCGGSSGAGFDRICDTGRTRDLPRTPPRAFGGIRPISNRAVSSSRSWAFRRICVPRVSIATSSPRFKRFPHRNEMLGRETTLDEQHFLERGRLSDEGRSGTSARSA